MQSLLQIEMKPDWGELSQTRKQVNLFLEDFDFSSEFKQQIIMVSSELLENALKYGNHDQHQIGFELDCKSTGISIEVKNKIDIAINHNLTDLDHSIQWIRGFQNPLEAFMQRLKEVSSMAISHRSSGVGLVRIACEGRAILDFYLNDASEVCISAEMADTGSGTRIHDH